MSLRRALPLVLTALVCAAALDAPVPANRAVTRISGLENRAILFTEPERLDLAWTGPPHLRFALRTGLLTPISAATADFDGDGLDDLVAGFGGPLGPAIGLLLTDETVASPAGPVLDPTAPPFRSATLLRAPVTPELIAAGDFDANGELDLVVAEAGATTLYYLDASSPGAFGPGNPRDLDGRIRTMVAGEINRQDGLEDLVLGLETPAGGRLELYQNPYGALSAAPEVVELASAATAVVIGQLDAHWAYDVAAAAGHQVVLVRGRDRNLVTDAEAGHGPAVRSIPLPGPVTGLAVGDFLGTRQRDLAALVNGAGLALLDLSSESRLLVPLQTSEQPRLLSATHVSAYGRDDLLLLDGDGRRLHILHEQHYLQAEPYRTTPAPEAATVSTLAPDIVSFELPAAAAFVASTRLNADPLSDLVLGLSSTPGSSAPGLTTLSSRAAASFLVNDSGNKMDANWGDGVCETEDGTCTLKAAIAESNYLHGGEHTYDEIRFSVGYVDEPSTMMWNGPVTIDGTSAGMVELNGPGMSSSASLSMVRGMAVARLSSGSLATLVAEKNHINLDASGIGIIAGAGLVVGGPYSVISENLLINAAIDGPESVFHDNLVGSTGSESIGFSGPAGSGGLRVGQKAANTVVRDNLVAGLSIDGPALEARGQGVVIQGNRLGVDLTGNTALPNKQDNLELRGSGPITVGGVTVAQANISSGSGWSGISGEIDSCYVLGNFIGTNAGGTAALGNTRWGIELSRSRHVVIGGSSPSARNVISANGNPAISLSGEGPFVIENNLIGTDVSGRDSLGTALRGMSGSGITLYGGLGSRIEHNVVAFGSGDGVWIGSGAGFDGPVDVRGNRIHHHRGAGLVVRGSRIRITENQIYANRDLGIALGSTSIPLLNDPGDLDPAQQNWPVLTPGAGGGLTGRLESTPSTAFTIEFFASEACDASGNGEGQVFLSSTEVQADASGIASFTASVATRSDYPFVAATATDPDGNSSEFSNCVELDPTVTSLLVQVLSDTTGGKVPTPLAETEFEIGTMDPDGAFHFFDSQITDEEGLLALSSSAWSPGEPLLVRNRDLGQHLSLAFYLDNIGIRRSGEVVVPRLAAGSSDTTRTYLQRVSIGISLDVEIQWRASDAYVASLIESFRKASNLLIDVTNGQTYIEEVRLRTFEGKDWSPWSAIRIVADNTAWPLTSESPTERITLPAALYGPEVAYATSDRGLGQRPSRKHNHAASILATSPKHPDHRETDWYARALVHELGHLVWQLYDEYQNQNGERLNDAINFSIMDDAFDLSSPMATELSRDVTDAFKRTEQFAVRQLSAWGSLEERSGWFLLKTPDEYGLPPGAWMEGPNASLQAPDLDMGAAMKVTDLRSGPRTEPLSLLIREWKNNAWVPAQDARVVLEKQAGYSVSEGATAPAHILEESFLTTGNIRILGAEPGDRLTAFRSRTGEVLYSETVLGVSKWVADPVTLDLQPVTGVPALLPAVVVDPQGGMRLEIHSEEPVAPSPELLARARSGTVSGLRLRLVEDRYETEVPPGAVELSLHLPGASVPNFVLPLPFEVLYPDADTRWFEVPGVGAVVRVHGDTEDPVILLSSPFAAPRDGLPAAVRPVSPVVSVGSTNGANLVADLTLFYSDSLFANSPDAVAVYRWQDGWQRLDSSVDFRLETVTARITEAGIYLAGLDGTQAVSIRSAIETPTPADPFGIYPNPFAGSTTIVFELETPSHVRVRVHDLIGRELSTVTDRLYPTGRQSLRFDGSGLPPGVYFYSIETDTGVRSGSMVLAR